MTWDSLFLHKNALEFRFADLSKIDDQLMSDLLHVFVRVDQRVRCVLKLLCQFVKKILCIFHVQVKRRKSQHSRQPFDRVTEDRCVGIIVVADVPVKLPHDLAAILFELVEMLSKQIRIVPQVPDPLIHITDTGACVLFCIWFCPYVFHNDPSIPNVAADQRYNLIVRQDIPYFYSNRSSNSDTVRQVSQIGVVVFSGN